MAVMWSKVLRSVASRVNAIAGAQAATAQSNYITEPITSAQMNSARFPFQMVADACVDAESQIAQTVANVINHPWRRILGGTTNPITSGNDIPLNSSLSLPIIGPYGAVLDYNDSTPLTEAPLEVIIRRRRSTHLILPSYFYKIVDRKIFHTRTQVTIDVCGYNRDTALSNLAGNNFILFPDVAVPIYVAGATAFLVKDEEYVQQAQVYAAAFTQMLSELATGATSISVNLPPSPQTGSETV